MAQWVRSLNLRTKLQTWCTLLAAAIDKVYQLLAHSRWFSQGTLASFITQTGCHDIAEILLKVTIITKNQSINYIMKLRFNSAKLAIVFVCLQFLPCIFLLSTVVFFLFHVRPPQHLLLLLLLLLLPLLLLLLLLREHILLLSLLPITSLSSSTLLSPLSQRLTFSPAVMAWCLASISRCVSAALDK